MSDDPTIGSGAGDAQESSTDPAGEDRLRYLLQGAADAPGSGDAVRAVLGVRRRVRRRRMGQAAGAVCAAAGLVAAVVTIPGGTAKRQTPVAEGGPPAYRLTGALVSFNGCQQYLDYVRQKAEAEVGPYGLQPYGQQSRYSSVGAGAAPAMGIQGASSAASNGAVVPALNQPTGSFSETNDQVAGVDEPDTVKTDGHIVVTLEGSSLHVLDASAHQLGSLQLPGGTGGGLLLDGDRAVVLSMPSVVSPDQPLEYGVATPLAVRPSSAQAAVVDLSNPADPTLLRTFLFDGSIVAARLVGGEIRLVDRTDGPRLNFVQPSDTGDSDSATAANKQMVANSTIQDWLPEWQVEAPDGSTSARQPISACDAVARPQTAAGLSTVSVFTLDPNSSAPGAGTSVVAAGDVVYATADHLYVAGEIESGGQPQAGTMQYGCCTVIPPNGASTQIFEFDTPSSGRPVFTGSGTVPGWLVNSYAMDESSDGVLRVASTEMTAGTAGRTGAGASVVNEGSADSQITDLQLSGDQLTPLGSVGGLGKGEVIRAVRFIGDQAYVVTFRSFDPLYVVDLKDPAHPALTGELDQPGFSEFLYPLPGQRLLGVGVQITDNEPSGLVVATYDVSNPAHPVRIDSSDLADGMQYGFQTYDPHAFLYWAPTNLALVALPGSPGYGNGTSVAAYTLGPTGHLTRAATLGHSPEPATRSLVLEGQVWVTTPSGVVTADLSNLSSTSWHPY